jgi:mannose-6-phosphate isomerase-like protein (cupin superfamily)
MRVLNDAVPTELHSHGRAVIARGAHRRARPRQRTRIIVELKQVRGDFMNKALLTLAATAIVFVSVSAQGDRRPTCRNCPGTYISNDEIQAYVKRAVANRIVDQQVRSVDIGKSGVAIGVVHRGKLTAPAADSVAEHDQVSEVYHIIDGSATLVTGPEVIGAKPRPADNEAVRNLNGPGSNGASIRNGATHQLKAGDVVIIPAGTGHWFTQIDDHITYLMVRIDPDKVVPLKDEAASKADLARAR